MSGINDWSQAERDLYAIGTRALLDRLERQQIEWRESVALDSTSTGDVMRQHTESMADLEAAHELRMQAMRDSTRAFIRSMYDDGEPDEGTHTDAAAGGPGTEASASPSSAGAPEGHDHRPQSNSLAPGSSGPHAAGRERDITAEDIAAMSWPEYAELRTTTGIGNASRGMFG